ncbi:MAG: hypothetical protein ACOYB1_10390 [Limnohabitans sp.]
MFKLLLKLLVLPPDLLKVHAQGYADLASQAWQQQLCVLKNRWVMYSLSVLSFLLALMLGGMAVLLWGTLPLMGAPHVWVLWALPLSLLLISVLCWVWARCLRAQPILDDIKAQIQLDMLAIGQAQAS